MIVDTVDKSRLQGDYMGGLPGIICYVFKKYSVGSLDLN